MDLFILVFGTATIAMLAVVAWSTWQSKKQPIRRVRAVVLSRRTRDYGVDIPANPFYLIINVLGRGPGRPRIKNEHMARLSGEVNVAEHLTYLMRFGFDGEEVELPVPESIFMTLQDGQQGTLVYQGEIFKHFMPDITQ